MRVEPIAWTCVSWLQVDKVLPKYQQHTGGVVRGTDELAEIAGRNCYQSWSRPSPKTSTNEGYLANILNHGHYSVLEHSSVTFLIAEVSRALLAELTRHRHLSFSVLSQRFVDHSQAFFTLPPGLAGNIEAEGILENHCVQSKHVYRQLLDISERLGLSRKQRMEAARSVLPESTTTTMIVTGNLRAWREVIEKRNQSHADAEIQQVAKKLLAHLKHLAPNTFQDF